MKSKIRIVILLGILPVACASWPPYANEAPDHFKANHDRLEKLRRLFEATDLVDASTSLDEGLYGRKSFDDTMEPVQVPHEDQIMNLFKALRLSGVYRVRGVTYLPLGFKDSDDTTYRWFYAASSDKQKQPQPCKQSLKQKPCSKCAIKLSNEWWIEYRWYPTDLKIAEKKCKEGPENPFH